MSKPGVYSYNYFFTITLTNLSHPPTSAYSPQDIILYTQEAHLSPKHLRHIQSREWFSILLLLHCSLSVKSNLHGLYINAVMVDIVCCVNHIHFICPLFIVFLKAFQTILHIPYVLCYNLLCDFVSLIFSLIRVHNDLREDIIQGKQ